MGLFLLLDFVLWVFVFGFVIFFVTCFFAFLGYILPCTMMSFWGLTVFSNLCACIPVLGFCVLGWIWCGEFINDFTLCKLHCLHIVTPLICFFLLFCHFFLFAFLYELWWFCWPFLFLCWALFFWYLDVFAWCFFFCFFVGDFVFCKYFVVVFCFTWRVVFVVRLFEDGR